jgi:hypothetical protein
LVAGSLGDRLAARMGAAARRGGLGGYAAYGLAYGLASFGCTLPIFLTVVGSALVVHGFLAGLLEFLLYSLGMGFVLGALTIAAAGFKQGALAPVRTLTRYASPASALLLLVTGGLGASLRACSSCDGLPFSGMCRRLLRGGLRDCRAILIPYPLFLRPLLPGPQHAAGRWRKAPVVRQNP